MKLASHKHFFLCFFYQSAFCLTCTHPQSNASNFVFLSRPRIFSMQPGAARNQTTNLQGLNRCPALPPELWEWKNEGGTQEQEQGGSCSLHAVCTDWETPPASLWSHRVCALCVSMLLCYSDELLRLWWLNELLSSWRIPSTLCTTYWTV